jgi:hypothetical protein
MTDQSKAGLRFLGFGLALAVSTVLLVRAVGSAVAAEKVCPDFICFWSAGKLLAAKQNPYDPAAQTEMQRAYGWNKATDGIGLYDCLPYFYPPWFLLLVTPLLRLDYATAKIAWLVVSVELLALSGLLLRDLLSGVARAVPLVVVCMFALSVFSVLMGQTPPLIFFLITAAWWLLDRERDFSAGCLLVWLAIKPQLSAVLLLGVFLWAIRQRRFGVFYGFVGMLSVLALWSTMVLPGWPLKMLQATGKTPLPTDYFPWYGTTWLLVGKTLGLRGAPLWAFYLGVALPILAWVCRTAWSRESRLADVFALTTLAAFFVAPYGQPYDFAILLIPFLVLLNGRLAERPGTLLLLVMLVVPYIHIHYAKAIRLWWVPPQPGRPITHQITFFWVPLLLAAFWLFTQRRGLVDRGANPAQAS